MKATVGNILQWLLLLYDHDNNDAVLLGFKNFYLK